jgi:anti-anti-sigma factor
MSHNDTFTITELNPAPAGASHGFALAGIMDAHCSERLRTLLGVDLGTRVVLDFAQVAQVNSMGLAQLLRLLDAWHSKGVRIEAVNANRMTSVLFKMTGLNRYFDNSVPRPASAAAVAPAFGVSSKPQAVPASPAVAGSAVPDRLTFQVCAQSVSQMSGWYFCNNYLQRKLERSIRINVAPPANTFDVQANEAHLMFVKPFEACHLMRNRGYQALARPLDEADEVVVVARAADARKRWGQFAGARAATATPNSFAYLLGRYLCEESGLDSARLPMEFAGNDIKALMLLLRGQADLLFMSHKTYCELSELSRRDTRVLEISQTQFAYPMLCASPQVAGVHGALRDALTGMGADPTGLSVLKELSSQGWVSLAKEEIDMLALLYERYALPSSAQASACATA